MPNFGDVKQFLLGQAFGKTTIPTGDLSGMTIIITGANTGLGLECAKHLAKKSVTHLILGCRNLEKGELAKQSILKESNGTTNVEVWQLDLDDYVSIVKFGQRASKSLSRLDGVVANAGVEMNDFVLSSGLEQTLKINVVSTFMFAFGILPKLQETSVKHGIDTNLTFVGSTIHLVAPSEQLNIPLDIEILDTLSDAKTADMSSRYPLSKLLCHQSFNEFQELVKQNKPSEGHVVVNLVNPGWCKTGLGRNKHKDMMERIMEPLLQWTGEEGGRTLVHGLMAGRETNGLYLSECQVKQQSSFVRSEAGQMIQRRLWQEVVARIEQTSPGLTSIACD